MKGAVSLVHDLRIEDILDELIDRAVGQAKNEPARLIPERHRHDVIGRKEPDFETVFESQQGIFTGRSARRAEQRRANQEYPEQ
jgi:hypothetical protein